MVVAPHPARRRSLNLTVRRARTQNPCGMSASARMPHQLSVFTCDRATCVKLQRKQIQSRRGDAHPALPSTAAAVQTHKHLRAAGKATHALTSFTSAGMLATQSGVCARFLWVNTAVCGSHLSSHPSSCHTRPHALDHALTYTRTPPASHTRTHAAQRKSC